MAHTSGLKDLICDLEGILIEGSKQRTGESGDLGALMSIFSDNYGCLVKDEERPYIKKILRSVGDHTYVVELIMKQMKASYLNARETLDFFKAGKISISETVAGAGRTKDSL